MAWQVSHPVVVPFDFSEYAIQALVKAVELVDEPSQIHALHVLPFMIPTEPGVVWATVDDASRIRNVLEHMAEVIPPSKFGNVCMDVRLGDPGQIVSQRAEELQAELIVCGSHGRTGLSHLMLGSVAERIMRLAHCPVLVIKLPVGAHLANPKKSREAVSSH